MAHALRIYFDARGVASTDEWRFEGIFECPRPGRSSSYVRPALEFAHGSRKYLFVGEAFLWAPPEGEKPPPLGVMPDEIVFEWLREVHDAREALVALLLDPEACRGVVVWEALGHHSNLLCVVSEPMPRRVPKISLDQALPVGCLLHLVDGGDGQARDAAETLIEGADRRGHDWAWIECDPLLEGRRPTALQALSVERAFQLVMCAFDRKDLHTDEPRPSDLIVLAEPALLPLETDLDLADLPPHPSAAVMWANFVPKILLRRTTIVVLHSISGIKRYPVRIAPGLASWRANARFETVYPRRSRICMSQVTLREAIMRKATVTYDDGNTETVEYEAKGVLRARKCAGCGRVYQMSSWNANDRNVGEWFATMEPPHGQNGNMLSFDVCSFGCAQKLTEGGWREVSKGLGRINLAKDFVEIDARPGRIECTITHRVKYVDELVEEWETAPELEGVIRVPIRAGGG